MKHALNVTRAQDFSAWYQVWLEGRWWDMDARHNHPRFGRILMATGRDAADVAITTSFGVANLLKFKVESNEVDSEGQAVPLPPKIAEAEGQTASSIGQNCSCFHEIYLFTFFTLYADRGNLSQQSGSARLTASSTRRYFQAFTHLPLEVFHLNFWWPFLQH